MKHDDLENDALWDLLRQSPGLQARPGFATDTVRAARLSAPDKPWWVRALVPLSGGGLLAGAAAMVIVTLTLKNAPQTAVPLAVNETASSSLAEIQDYAETQALATAADHLSDYSDAELASLAGF